MRIKATLLVLFGLLAFCQAQLKVTLQFGSASPREIFVASSLPVNSPSVSVKAAGVSLDFNVPAFGGDDRIYVWDRSTNNIASKAIKDIANGTWAIKPEDFSIIGLVTVHIEHKGLPVQAAKVILSTKGKAEEKLLDPSEKGEIQFFGYPAGDLHVKVAYNTSDKKQGAQEQIFPVALKRDRPEPLLSLAIADDVATSNEPGTPPASGQNNPAKQSATPSKDEGSSAGKLVVIVLALGVVFGFGFWIFNMAKNHPKEFEERLTKLGVQVPKQQDPNDALAGVTPAPLAPAPPAPKIMLDDSDPVPLGGAFPVSMPIMSGGDPTLVKESGERIGLAEGETIVGRDDGLGVSLSGESTVSRRHASVSRSGSTTIVKDLGSTNGTFVNGTRLQGETTLKPGDQVMFGSVRFRYEG